MRQLASIKEVKDIIPIEGKDRIELAIIDGWSVIIKKGEFKVGDKCIYVEIDSVMPDRPEFDFLRGKNFRIKTMKMAGVISQGICFPTTLLKEDYPIGTDVTEELGIVQYEATRDIERPSNGGKRPPIKHYPKWLMRYEWFRQYIYKKDHRGAKGFPDFISKTDECRIQSIPFTLTNKDPWVVTEKVDGCSSTYALRKYKNWYGKVKYEFIVCSRNLRLFANDGSHYWKIAETKGMEKILKAIIGDNDWVAIQGEICGPGIQKNKYKLNDFEFYGYNLIYPTGRTSSLVANSILGNLGLKFVPILDKEFILPDTVDEMLKYAHAKSVLYDGTLREGVVCRTLDGQRSFKAVDPEFLIKYDE